MRGPLLSGPLGSQPSLEALLRWSFGQASPEGGAGAPPAAAPASAPVVVLGPAWLGSAVARGGRALLLVESDVRPQAVRALRRARKESQPLDVALAAAELPFRRGSLSALVVENVAGLAAAEAERWIAALAPLLRPGGRLDRSRRDLQRRRSRARGRRLPGGGAARHRPGVAARGGCPHRRRRAGGRGHGGALRHAGLNRAHADSVARKPAV